MKFNDKLELMAQGLADRNIITMLLIFLTAGSFVGVVGRTSAESVAYFMLSLIPARFAALSDYSFSSLIPPKINFLNFIT